MSAALQTAPQHQSNILAPAPITSTSGRPHYASQPSPTAAASNTQQPTAAAQTSKRSPAEKTSRHTHDASSPASNPAGMLHNPATQSPPTDRASNMPPVAPPRTSSTQQTSSSRRNQYPADRTSGASRHGQPENPRTGSRGEVNGSGENGQRSSKRTTYTQPTSDPTRSAEGKDPRGATMSMPVRTAQPPPSSSRSREVEGSGRPSGEYSRSVPHSEAPAPPAAEEQRRGTRSRHDYSNRQHKGTAKFGEFILGNTIGEGEFGKVKLGWKQDDDIQVAIKLIKRDTVGSNPSRMAKIRREVTILRAVKHPNIVALIDMVETDRYMGIVLEYASGGELFDYILNHRYLKDQSARRLFAQLVSGVGYLHKKGIVHRDLKLENLLLDRHRNIIITDFGFANTFDPNEELLTEEELNLSDKDYVKRIGLDKVKSDGTRKGDLMQTSCGSPCYAAPELVVSDSLYTGRKVDVWSCGVILYAMLAGYLPFDDDPANPEGDNINLLYKYIVTTPLTFPEYVTPHARDLLRRILVPNPRKRADLFEVARHSWLSEYAHVVEFITSSTTLPADVQAATNAQEDFAEAPGVARSSSVREGPKRSPQAPPVGGLAKATGKIDPETEPRTNTPKDAKRRTVQVEYVAPTTQTQRGDGGASGSRARSASRNRGETQTATQDKPLPRDPPVSRDDSARPSTGSKAPPAAQNAAPAARPPRDPKATMDKTLAPDSAAPPRPRTGGSMSSAASMGLHHYGQPAPPAVADTNAEGRIQQPLNEDDAIGRTGASTPTQSVQASGLNDGRTDAKGHKRSSTMGEIGQRLLGRNGSMFGGRSKKRIEEKKESRKYPPVSMTQAMAAGEEPGRQSTDSKMSRRSFSLGLGLGKKQSGSMSGSQGSGEKADRRRFSLLPPSFSLKGFGSNKDPNSNTPSESGSQTQLPIQHPRSDGRSVTSHGDARGSSPLFDPSYHNAPQQTTSSPRHQRFASAQLDNRKPTAIPPYLQSGLNPNTASDPSVDTRPQQTEAFAGYQQPYTQSEGHDGQRIGTGASRTNNNNNNGRGVLHKGHKKFTDAYNQDDFSRGHEGSSGAAKRVMDFFRRRGKARGGEDR